MDVLFEGDRAVGVKLKDREVRAKVVVDASGQNGAHRQSAAASGSGIRS